MEKMGIMDTVLRPHLEALTKFRRDNELLWFRVIEAHKEDVNADQKAKLKRLRLDQESEIFRQQGNQYFKAHDFNQALHFYTKSIAAAIQGPLASLAYFNRSAALFQMELFEDCIEDIDRALNSGYPKKQQLYSLYLRKVKCLKFLKKNYVGCLANAMKAINDHNSTDEAKRLTEIVLCQMEDPAVPELQEKLPKANILKLPELSYGKNPEVPSYSSAVNLEYNKKVGRHFIANRDINAGDVLMVEKSVISSIYDDVHWNFCNLCFVHCNTLIPCTKCGDTMYCSEKCRSSDWKSSGHKGVCNKLVSHPKTLEPFKHEEFIIPALESRASAMKSLIVRLFTCIGLDTIKKAVLENNPLKSFEDPRTKGFQGGQFGTATLEALLSLEDQFDKWSSEEVNAACKVIVIFCGFLQIPPDLWLLMGAVFLKLYHSIDINCTVIESYKADYNSPTMSMPKMQLGTSLLLAFSLMNHSCDANVYQVCYGTTVVFRARRPICKGEEVTFCYKMPATKNSYEERQKTLLESFNFKCSCTACTGSYTPLLASLPPLPPLKQLKQWLKAAGIEHTTSQGIPSMLDHFFKFELPATNPMLPKLMVLLQRCLETGLKSNKLYFNVQKIIQNHYRVLGNSIFFGDAEEIFSGTLDYSKEDINLKIEKMKLKYLN